MEGTYKTILSLLCVLLQALDNAMILCQSWGFNGFKRKYRFYGMCFAYWKKRLQCEMWDDHGIVAPLEHEAHKAYMPVDIKDHSEKWVLFIKDIVTRLRECNIQLLNQKGKQSKWLECIICLAYCEQEKAVRWLARGKKMEWMEHDLHRQDDVLHEKMKCVEKKVQKAMRYKK